MAELILKEESYKVIGMCMEVHRELGMGFKEHVYQDALEIEFQNKNIQYQRETFYKIEYKSKILKHRYKADFVVFNQIRFRSKSNIVYRRFICRTNDQLFESIWTKIGHHCQLW